MYHSMIIAALAATSFAYPGQLLSKRALKHGEVTRDPSTGCPAYLAPGEYEFPHYITQISASQPDKSFGPSFFGEFTPNDISTIFAFDIPIERYNDSCTLEFIWPLNDQMTSSHYEVSDAQGGTFFSEGYAIGDCPDGETTYNNQPAPGQFPAFPPIHMEPGYAYELDTGPCKFTAGSCVGGRTWSNDTTFRFFQNSGDCPIGIYNAYNVHS